ncbi:MAG: FadR family transcriptional regulator [Anaerotruncus sp.]|nr:FadR family transcriptional regulator [Anaerotruncus sp.]
MAYTNNASQVISDFIVENIQSGTWIPGDKIWSESEFCQNLDVSRIAVRDAIANLSAISVLKKVKGSGTYVEQPENVSLEGIRYFKMTPEDMLELMEFRYLMDSYCTELFTQRATDKEIRELEECYHKMIEHRGDLETYNFYSNEFHLLIARGSKNHFILKVIEYLRDNMLTHQNVLSQDIQKEKFRIGISYHYKILQAIKQRDTEMAGTYCRYHIRRSMELYRNATAQTTQNRLFSEKNTALEKST